MVLTVSKVMYFISAVAFLGGSLTGSVGPFALFPLGFCFLALGKAVE